MKNWIFNEKRTAAKFTAIAVALLLLFPLSGGCAKPQSKEKVKGKNMSLLQKKPVYSLTVEVFGTTHYIKVNGITVIRDVGEEGQTSVVLPVNH